MPSFTQLFAFTLLAAVGFAAPSPSGSLSNCPGATLVHNKTVPVGGNVIQYTSHSCSPSTISRRGLFDSPPLCILLGTCRPPPPPSPKNVCGAACTTSCNNSTGVLPPVSQDCQTIVNSIQIFQGQQPDAFTVSANHVETLSFGTCSFFFENLSPNELEYCFSSLSTEGSAAGAACFPPVQPFFPEGLCTATDGTWAVGATHS